MNHTQHLHSNTVHTVANVGLFITHSVYSNLCCCYAVHYTQGGVIEFSLKRNICRLTAQLKHSSVLHTATELILIATLYWDILFKHHANQMLSGILWSECVWAAIAPQSDLISSLWLLEAGYCFTIAHQSQVSSSLSVNWFPAYQHTHKRYSLCKQGSTCRPF